jgi:hypothetical protein
MHVYPLSGSAPVKLTENDSSASGGDINRLVSSRFAIMSEVAGFVAGNL